MEKLLSQEQFEGFIASPNSSTKEFSPLVIIYFTAKWCGACKRIDWNQILNESRSIQMKLYVCDIDVNEYTAGYCDVRAVPSFQAIVAGKPVKLFSSSNTGDIMNWINSLI